MKNILIINDLYQIDVSKNLFTNTTNGEEVRLEPRIMKLLVLLVENCGQVTKREIAIDTIWGNYGGADEGLTQAISFLRKILQDKDKKIIKTVPKKGYVFEANISELPTIKEAENILPKQEVEVAKISKKTFKQLLFLPQKTVLVLLFIFSVLFTGYWAISYLQKTTQNNGVESQSNQTEQALAGEETPMAGAAEHNKGAEQ